MVDAIIREIRRMRDKASKEIRRDPEAARLKLMREVMAMASNVVYTGPHTFTADFTVPDNTRKKQRIRPKKNCSK